MSGPPNLPRRNGVHHSRNSSISSTETATAESGADATIFWTPISGYSTPLVGSTYRRPGPAFQQRTIVFSQGYSVTFGDHDPVPTTGDAFVAQVDEVERQRAVLAGPRDSVGSANDGMARDVDVARRLGRVDFEELERVKADIEFARYYHGQPWPSQVVNKHEGRNDKDGGKKMDVGGDEDEDDGQRVPVVRAPPSTPVYVPGQPRSSQASPVNLGGSARNVLDFGKLSSSKGHKHQFNTTAGAYAPDQHPVQSLSAQQVTKTSTRENAAYSTTNQLDSAAVSSRYPGTGSGQMLARLYDGSVGYQEYEGDYTLIGTSALPEEEEHNYGGYGYGY